MCYYLLLDNRLSIKVPAAFILTMSKVTSKFQVSIPKALAERIGIRVGDELSWEAAAGTLRARVATAAKPRVTLG